MVRGECSGIRARQLFGLLDQLLPAPLCPPRQNLPRQSRVPASREDRGLFLPPVACRSYFFISASRADNSR